MKYTFNHVQIIQIIIHVNFFSITTNFLKYFITHHSDHTTISLQYKNYYLLKQINHIQNQYFNQRYLSTIKILLDFRILQLEQVDMINTQFILLKNQFFTLSKLPNILLIDRKKQINWYSNVSPTTLVDSSVQLELSTIIKNDNSPRSAITTDEKFIVSSSINYNPPHIKNYSRNLTLRWINHFISLFTIKYSLSKTKHSNSMLLLSCIMPITNYLLQITIKHSYIISNILESYISIQIVYTIKNQPKFVLSYSAITKMHINHSTCTASQEIIYKSNRINELIAEIISQNQYIHRTKIIIYQHYQRITYSALIINQIGRAHV